MQILVYILAALMLLGIELAYIPIARRNRWSTERNRRADNHPVTVVGGGIIFYVGMVIWNVATGLVYGDNMPSANFIVGLTMLAACSFADDLMQLKVWIRLVVQTVATIFLGFQCIGFGVPLWLWPLYLLCTVGFINAYNFMDGINGITAAYSMVTLGTFMYLNQYVMHFVSGSMIMIAFISVVIFAFFNFRRRAIVFAGDVGSICMGFIVATLVIDYIVTTGDYLGFIFVIVYGVDTFLTVFRRLAEGENIFMPHRKHIYQLLCHVWKVGQLKVAVGYALLQGAISAVYIMLPAHGYDRAVDVSVTGIVLVAAYFVIMMASESRRRHIQLMYESRRRRHGKRRRRK